MLAALEFLIWLPIMFVTKKKPWLFCLFIHLFVLLFERPKWSCFWSKPLVLGILYHC